MQKHLPFAASCFTADTKYEQQNTRAWLHVGPAYSAGVAAVGNEAASAVVNARH